FTDAADVFLPVLGREAEIPAEPVAHDVPVERVDSPAATQQRTLERHRERGLARARQSGQPDDSADVPRVRAVFHWPLSYCAIVLRTGHRLDCHPRRSTGTP